MLKLGFVEGHFLLSKSKFVDHNLQRLFLGTQIATPGFVYISLTDSDAVFPFVWLICLILLEMVFP